MRKIKCFFWHKWVFKNFRVFSGLTRDTYGSVSQCHKVFHCQDCSQIKSIAISFNDKEYQKWRNEIKDPPNPNPDFYCGDKVDFGEKCSSQCNGCNDAIK